MTVWGHGHSMGYTSINTALGELIIVVYVVLKYINKTIYDSYDNDFIIDSTNLYYYFNAVFMLNIMLCKKAPRATISCLALIGLSIFIVTFSFQNGIITVHILLFLHHHDDSS